MSHVAKVIRLVASSPKGVEDAIEQGLEKASKTIHGIHCLKMTDWTMSVEDNKITNHKVTLEVAFDIDD